MGTTKDTPDISREIRVTSESKQGSLVQTVIANIRPEAGPDEFQGSYRTEIAKNGLTVATTTNIFISNAHSMVVKDISGEKTITDSQTIKDVLAIMTGVAKRGITMQESDRMFNLQTDLQDDGKLNNSYKANTPPVKGR